MDQIITLARSGSYGEARSRILDWLREKPSDPHAWFWLACVTDNPWEALTSLHKVIELDPSCVEAKEGIAWARAQIAAGRRVEPLSAPFVPSSSLPEEPDEAPAEPSPARLAGRSGYWTLVAVSAIILLAVAGLGAHLVLFDGQRPVLGAPAEVSMSEGEGAVSLATTPMAWEDAWNSGDWPAAIAHLEDLYSQEAGNMVWRGRLFDAHVRYGNELASRGRLDEALAEFDAAMALRPYDAELQQARGLAGRYLLGLQHYQAGDWSAAVQVLTAIYAEEGNYRDTQDLLFSAHYNLGLAYQAAGKLDEAEEEYRLALQLRGSSEDIETRLARIRDLRTPPTPTPTGKRIEVSISEQRLYAYENDQLVYSFICSTGESASPTVPGSYQILDKIPNAYASTWNLQMPYWMGIYWAGTLENGIHALPILSNGQILWDGFLGQRVSFGCIILSTEDARALYNWAEVGVPVIIRY